MVFKKKFSLEEWAEAKRLFTEEGLPYPIVSEKTGIAHSTLTKTGGPKRQDWLYLRKKAEIKKQALELHEFNKRLIAGGKIRADARATYYRIARRIAEVIEIELDAWKHRPMPKDLIAVLATSLRKAQEVEFAALGLASHRLELEDTTPKTFRDYMVDLEKQRGVPERTYPFSKTAIPAKN